MIEISLPGSGDIQLEHLVLDYNGTIAADGKLIVGVEERLLQLSRQLSIYVVTADTYGSVQKKLAGLPCTTEVLAPGFQNERKRDVITPLLRTIPDGSCSTDRCRAPAG